MRDQVHPSIIGGIQSIITPKDVACSATYFEARLTGQLGYGTNDLSDFIRLDDNMAKYQLFKCIEVDPGSLYPFRCEWLDNSLGERFYYDNLQFFLPADRIRKGGEVEQEKPKESKARPFTIAEFKQRFYPPCVVCYRLKDSRGTICSPVIVGQIKDYSYILGDDDSLEIVLSGMSSAVPLKARWLFDHVEWSPSGDLIDWRPFGVEGV